MGRLLAYWDSFELWLSNLAFGYQVALVLVVIVPIAASVASVMDRLSLRLFPEVASPRPEADPQANDARITAGQADDADICPTQHPQTNSPDDEVHL